MPAEIGTARAFWSVAPGRGEIRTESLPARGRDEVLVRALTSGISRGTEALVFQGRIPESQYTIMRCPFQAGSLPFPVKYGYASVGLVEADLNLFPKLFEFHRVHPVSLLEKTKCFADDFARGEVEAAFDLRVNELLKLGCQRNVHRTNLARKPLEPLLIKDTRDSKLCQSLLPTSR